MIVEFSDKQFELLYEVVEEYRDMCYDSMFDYKHCAVDAEDPIIKKQYNDLADEEEERFNTVKKLAKYLKRYRPEDEDDDED